MTAQQDDPRRAYFDRMYGGDADPYRVKTRWYERRKRELLLAALPRPRFARAFEPACGVGELTAALAARCDFVLASDFNPQALAATRARTAALPQVQVEPQRLPRDWPRAQPPFELIVIAEIGYFLSEPELLDVARCCAASLSQQGVLVGCHWRPAFAERTLPSERVHELLGAGMNTLATYFEDDFLLQLWSHDPRSVAQREGIR